MTIEMTRRALDLWTAALESEEYTQGPGTLRRTDKDGEDTFCCLGVFCDVMLKNGLEMPVKRNYDDSGESITSWSYGAARNAADLPEEVKNYAKFKEYPGLDQGNEHTSRYSPEYGLSQTRLIGYNDNDGLDHRTFPEIAQILREQVVVIDD